MRTEWVTAAFDGLGVEWRQELPLAPFSTFRIGGTVALALFPRNEQQLCDSVKILLENHIPFDVIGNGSNLLFGDGRLEGALIFTKNMTVLRRDGCVLDAACGVSLAALAVCGAEASLTGLEFARGIPGTVGGAVYMNAGAYGGSMSQVLRYSHALDLQSGEILRLEADAHEFGYRNSVYMKHKGLICLGASFALSVGDPRKIEETMREFARSRKEKQPLEYPSAGSYFKRPEGHFAGKLIEDCGLKGMRVGGAAVSDKHAGFLINLGGATAADVLALEAQVRERVLAQFGVVLEREVRVIDSLTEKG